MSILRFLLGVTTGALITVLLAFRLLGTSEAAADLMPRDTPRLDLSVNERPLPMRAAPDLAAWRPGSSAEFDSVVTGRIEAAPEPKIAIIRVAVVGVARNDLTETAAPAKEMPALGSRAGIEPAVEPAAPRPATIDAVPPEIDRLINEAVRIEPAAIGPLDRFAIAAIDRASPVAAEPKPEVVVFRDEEGGAIAFDDLRPADGPLTVAAIPDRIDAEDSATTDAREHTVHVPLPETVRLPPLRSEPVQVSRRAPKPAVTRTRPRRQVAQQPAIPNLLPTATTMGTNNANPLALLFPFGRILNQKNNTAVPHDPAAGTARN